MCSNRSMASVEVPEGHVSPERANRRGDLAAVLFLLVFGVGWPVLVSVLACPLTVPRNDAFAYSKIAQTLADHGTIQLVGLGTNVADRPHRARATVVRTDQQSRGSRKRVRHRHHVDRHCFELRARSPLSAPRACDRGHAHAHIRTGPGKYHPHIHDRTHFPMPDGWDPSCRRIGLSVGALRPRTGWS